MSVSEKAKQKWQANNSNRMYTPEEDEEILAYWWDKDARADLCRRLGRTQAAVAQRFYAIVKARNIDPKKYRQEMRRRAREKLVEQATKEWTTADEMKLWRLVKSGMSLEEVSEKLHRPVAECMRKLTELKLENMDFTSQSAEEPKTADAAVDTAVEVAQEITPPRAEERFFSEAELIVAPKVSESRVEQPSTVTVEEPAQMQETAPVFQADDDILEILKDFPQKVRSIENRLNDLEKANQLLRENIEFVLEEVAAGLKNTGGFLAEQKQHFTAFEQLKQEKQALEQELQALRAKMEEEKRELRKTYQEIDFWLGEFLKLRKIEKVASLSDLIPKLKYSYDRFGVLLDIKRE